MHKSNGGTFQNFVNKKYAQLTDQRLLNHLNGKEVIGIYPLLENNTSGFIAADFDQALTQKKTWLDECRIFIAECKKYYLPVYLERSRSGIGGHVWLFFEQPYPAFKSRKIFKHLLQISGIVSDKKINSNFDRLFPNQDELSGKGLGNLIALPLQKFAVEKGNSVFIDPMNGEPFADQWQFLETINKISAIKLDELYSTFFPALPETLPQQAASPLVPAKELQITLSNKVFLPRAGLYPAVLKYLKDTLNFINPAYFIRKQQGLNTYGTEKTLQSVENEDENIAIPRGFIRNLLLFCNQQRISYQLIDKRIKSETISFSSTINLHDFQREVVDTSNKKEFGVIVAPPGSGKTIIALEIVRRKQQRTLIIVHRKQLLLQWMERIESFLSIPKFQIGVIDGGNHAIGEEITVAMMQSLISPFLPDREKLYQTFGTIIVDECHHLPAKTFRDVIQNFNSWYMYGFTATPFRKNRDERIIFFHIGDIIHEVVIPVKAIHHKKLSVQIQHTEFSTPLASNSDNIETLLKVLIYDTARNERIVSDVKREVKAGRKVLVLTERKDHVELLKQYLKDSTQTISLTGEDTDQSKKNKLQTIENGDFEVLIATGQFIGEGTDLGMLDCLVLAFPFSFEGKLVQYIGRVQRSTLAPIIYDYRDRNIEYLENLFNQRNKYYRKLLNTGHIQVPEELQLIFHGSEFYINNSTERFQIDSIDLPLPVQSFKEGIVWKLRVNKYNEEDGKLSAEVIDYQFPLSKVSYNLQGSFYYQGIETIKFRALDTNGFLQSVILKDEHILVENKKPVERVVELPKKQVIIKSIKVPIANINFLNAGVSFPIFIAELNQEIIFEISNPDIRPEFSAIREYFIKALRKKVVNVDITIEYTSLQILSFIAKSTEIDSINGQMIDSLRFEFVKSEVITGRFGHSREMSTYTIDDLLHSLNEGTALFTSGAQLIDDLLKSKPYKHHQQLKYLSSKHEAGILRLRFVLQPFSFLFLLSGEKKYHIVWETLDSEEATYVWHTDRTRESLKQKLSEIELILKEIKQSGRQQYLTKDNEGFTRVLHDYADPQKGFVNWKSALEKLLV